MIYTRQVCRICKKDMTRSVKLFGRNEVEHFHFLIHNEEIIQEKDSILEKAVEGVHPSFLKNSIEKVFEKEYQLMVEPIIKDIQEEIKSST